MLSKLARGPGFIAVLMVVLFELLALGLSQHLVARATNASREQTTALLDADERALEAIIGSNVLRALPLLDRLPNVIVFGTDGRPAAGRLNVPVDAAKPGQTTVVQVQSDGAPGGPLPARLVAVRTVQLAGEHTLVFGRDIDDQRRLLTTLRTFAYGAIGFTALIGLGTAVFVTRRFNQRLAQVTATSRTIMGGDLGARLPIDGTGEEFDQLAGELNAMLARIEELMASFREVSDNIAHDLKTPLTRLRNRAEAVLRGDTGTAHDALAGVIDDADDLIRTFNALLLIARLEGRALSDTLVTLDASALVADVLELYESAAEEAGIALKTRLAPNLWIEADRQLLMQAVGNLVDNAIKYSAGVGREITVFVTLIEPAVATNRAEIIVGDRGPGIPPEDRERALKRFVRLEKSRSQPGTGLGLSLVSAVARLHGAALRIEDNAPGLRVVLQFPTKPA